MKPLQVLALCMLTAVLAAAPGPLGADRAEAIFFNDVCRPMVGVRGPVRGSQRAAMNAGIAAWRKAVRRVYGRRFTDWNYSGDNSFDCSWDRSGRRFQCHVKATPCARGR